MLKLNSYVKNHICEYVVFLWKSDEWWSCIEVVFCWTWNEFMSNCVDDVWKHVVDELVWWFCSLVNWWWKLLLMLNNYESFGEFLNWNKMMFDSWVLSILVYVFMYMTYKLYLGRVLSVEGSKLECLGKRVLKFEVFILDWRVFA